MRNQAKNGALSLIALLLVAASASPALAQGEEFMAGRIYQIALEIAAAFTPVAEIAYGELDEAGAQSYEMSLTAGTCYTWIAVSEDGQRDVDLVVYVNDAPVTGDNAPDDWPVAQYCTATDVQARIDVVLYARGGRFAYRAFSRFFGGTDQIELNMNYLATMYAPDATPLGPIARTTLAASGEQIFPLALEGGHCYTIIGTAGAGVADIDFFLAESDGDLVSADEAVDNYPVVGVCTPTDGNYTLRALMYAGAGELGWQIFRAPIPQ